MENERKCSFSLHTFVVYSQLEPQDSTTLQRRYTADR